MDQKHRDQLIRRVDGLVEQGKNSEARNKLRSYVGQFTDEECFALRLGDMHAVIGEEVDAARFWAIGLSQEAEHQPIIASWLSSLDLDALARVVMQARHRSKVLDELSPAMREEFTRRDVSPEQLIRPTPQAKTSTGEWLAVIGGLTVVVGPWLIGAWVVIRMIYGWLRG